MDNDGGRQLKRFISTPENMEITEALVATFRNLKNGETVDNARIDNLMQGKRHLVTKARHMVEREQGCVLATVIGVGVKKLDPDAAHTVGKVARGKALRTTLKARNRIVGVIRAGHAGMDRQARLRLSSEVNKLGFIAEMCQDDE